MNNKVLSFIIALKRFKNNSVILKKAKYKMAHQIGLHPNTFIKYLKEAIDCGYIYQDDSKYHIAPLKDILIDFYEETELVFLSHSILLSKETNYKKVLSEIEYCLIIDNVYEMQEKAKRKKERFIESAERILQTGQSHTYISKSEYKSLKNLLKKEGGVNGVAKKLEEQNYMPINITSARHTAKKLNISTSKANRLLSSVPGFHRYVHVLWVDGCSLPLYDALVEQYPRSTIYPMVSINKIKVCSGSSLIPSEIKGITYGNGVYDFGMY
jgi:hypothetical protein